MNNRRFLYNNNFTLTIISSPLIPCLFLLVISLLLSLNLLNIRSIIRVRYLDISLSVSPSLSLKITHQSALFPLHPTRPTPVAILFQNHLADHPRRVHVPFRALFQAFPLVRTQRRRRFRDAQFEAFFPNCGEELLRVRVRQFRLDLVHDFLRLRLRHSQYSVLILSGIRLQHNSRRLK